MIDTFKIASRIAVVLIIALLPSVTYAAPRADQPIRVELTRFSRASCITISTSSGDVTVSTPDSKYTTPSIELRMDAARVACKSLKDGQTFASECVRVEPTDPSAVLRLESNGKGAIRVRGFVEARVGTNGIRLLNTLGLEDYVLGVLPAEMPESYPIEALKAQAVTIRTYSLRNKNKHAASGSDLCDSTHCQAYSGVMDKRPQCLRAVQETAGLILSYSGGPAHVFYSADGGGSTQNYADTHPGSKIPYLCGAKDPDGVPHTSWEKSYTLTELAERLAAGGIKEAIGLQTIRIVEIAQTGRVVSVEISGPCGVAKVYATTLRDKLGLDEFKSTLFTMEVSEQGVVTFKGKGYGHGAGLCQVGAKGLAQPPFNYTWDRILTHYFPGTTIGSASSARVAMASPPPQPKPATVITKPQKLPQQPRVSAPPRKQPPAKKPERALSFDVMLIDPSLH